MTTELDLGNVVGPTGPTGPPGPKGDTGDSPVRGIDYWTADDMSIINTYIDQKIGLILDGQY